LLDPKKREGVSKGDARFLEIIDRFGWHVMSVAPLVGEEGHCFSYSTGLFMRFQHPEIILCGLDPETSRLIINGIGGQVKAGKKFEKEKSYSGIFGKGMKCQFRPVLFSNYGEYVCWASWFYEYSEFPVLQCFWPDKKGHFPWDDKCHPDVVSSQPKLFLQPPSVM
jgi:hypothetical protein